ncbi:MAG TPA: STAS domain-containing protein [Vicinamibacteria bacterium]|nr:STAS domain-containing protein [Vicinamibacteria bacterium]
MSLNVRNEDTRPFAKTMFLEGRLDTNTAVAFDTELDTMLESPIKVLVLDLAELEYLSSAGIRSLYRAQKLMKARAGKTLIVNPRPSVKKVFDIVKAVDLSSVFASVKELDDYLDVIQQKGETE